MESRETVRYAILGCGKHAIQGHIIPGREVPSLKLVGAFDPDWAKMRAAMAARNRYGSFAHYDSEDALLEDACIDAVVIASPDSRHMATLAAAVKAGKHVLCDKPLACTPEEIDTLKETLDLAQERSLVVTSCHPRRFDPPYVWLKNELSELREWFGPVLGLELDFSYHAPSKEGLHSGLLADHFNHEFDLLHFLFGHAEAQVLKLEDGDMRYLATGIRSDRIAFTFHGTRMLEARAYREFVRIRFAAGEVRLNCNTGDAVTYDHETSNVREVSPGKTDYALRFSRVMENFAGAILGTHENYLTRQDLLANAESCVVLTHGTHYAYAPA